MLEPLTAREQAVLHAVVHLHISSGCPVGSEIVTRHMRQSCSSATVRNVMARLSESGYLAQPHTSAGRVPTWAGYRCYVSHLLENPRWESPTNGENAVGWSPPGSHATDPANEHAQQSQQWASSFSLEHEAPMLVRTVSFHLASMTRSASIAIGPFLRRSVIEHMEFIRLRPHTLLAILVTKAGVVHHKTVAVDAQLGTIDLEHLNNYLKSQIGNVTLDELVRRIRTELNEERANANSLLQSALLLAEQTLRADADNADVVIEGKEHLLELQRFESIEKIRPILAAMEHRELWLELLEQCTDGDVVEIRIGAENLIQGLDECAVITVPYGTRRGRLGTLGIIGPMRMDYRTMIPAVHAAAQLLSARLTANEYACS